MKITESTRKAALKRIFKAGGTVDSELYQFSDNDKWTICNGFVWANYSELVADMPSQTKKEQYMPDIFKYSKMVEQDGAIFKKPFKPVKTVSFEDVKNYCKVANYLYKMGDINEPLNRPYFEVDDYIYNAEYIRDAIALCDMGGDIELSVNKGDRFSPLRIVCYSKNSLYVFNSAYIMPIRVTEQGANLAKIINGEYLKRFNKYAA